MKEKLIKLLTESDILCDYCGQHSNTYCIEALAEYLTNKGVMMLDKTDMPKIIKKDFMYDSGLGWYVMMQQQWFGQSFFLCQQIPSEPSAYINAIIKKSLKEEE